MASILLGTLSSAGILYIRHRQDNPLSDERYLIDQAKAAQKERNYFLAAEWLSRAVALNPFKKEYRDAERRSCAIIRAFDRVIALGEPDAGEDPENFAWYAYAHFRTGNRSYAKQLKKELADCPDEAVRFVCTIASLDGLSPQEARSTIAPFAEATDSLVRMEACLVLGELAESLNDGVEADRLYAAAGALCPEVALPHQIARCEATNRPAEALRLRDQLLTLHPTPELYIEQAEHLALARHVEGLALLPTRYVHHSLDALIVSCYTDALRAWCTGDMENMIRSLEPTRTRIRTAFSLMMAVQADVFMLDKENAATPDTTSLEYDWKALQNMPSFANTRERAYLAIRSYVGASLSRGTKPRAFGPLAETMLAHGVRDRGFAKMALAYDATRELVTAERALEQLQNWPRDPDIRHLVSLTARKLAADDHPNEAERLRAALEETKPTEEDNDLP